ncbi:exodeoxyribonuclease V subunit beta [Entomohabitans teleogrylli]|uniref:exodeoxyribonuclease V subunit beta n=1 Tax=Entomohabitans teleogrylli TaxID=1384589 RepID=UPI00073D4B50|nr:exodeoxyribonuclease V subunit beta [Entomohabitans teleogrylli]
MTDETAQPLDSLTLPLQGARLIEASAGTGKTFTIAALYLRLLLGLGGAAAFPRPLGVEELLVVTFTEAATEELRGRIRSNIHALRIACVRGQTDNPLFQRLLEEIDDLARAAQVLLLAERQMDEAAIFTIHGFCQRMLNLNAFESGMLFEQQLLEDETHLRRQACADFWRRHCYPLPKPVAQAVSEIWTGPEALLRDIYSYLQGEQPLLKRQPPQEETLLSRHEKIVAAIDEVKTQWRAAAGELAALISDSGVDKRSFSSRNLPTWLDKIGEWAGQPTTSYQLPDPLGKFAQSFLDEKTKKGPPPRHPLFSAIDALLSEPLTLRDLVLARAISEIRYTVETEKRRRGEMGFDDMLSRLDAALRQPGGEALAAAIRRRFPAAMIDEFQDTDPQQYRIFRRVWLNQPQTALLLIGDPKQAIYAFRGADIFTYMKARREVSAHYTLDTNWRSSPEMIHCVNRLFSQQENAFLFRQIPFLVVKSAASNSGLCFTLQGKAQAAMTLWNMPGEGVGVSDYQQVMARQCAAQICDWLAAGQRGEALLWRGEQSRAVQASDITVLVRSRNEAAIVRDALGALNIQSVYLSNRDSVFATLEAREMLWLLQAVLAPEKESTLRSAMATGIIGLDAAALDALSQQESAWDSLVEEFDGYRELWVRRGVMPMFSALMARRQVAENILATPGGERRLTDILHLSELLQEAAGQIDSEHALVRWLAQNIAEPDSNAASQQLRLESDKHLVQVVTIHKSKGLEYPLVWLPFIASYRAQSQALYHDRQTFETFLDLGNDAESLGLAEEERLAEDLRLLYVAVTRSVWHASLGIAPLFRGNRAKKGVSDFHLSAIGFLIQKGEALEAAELQQALASLCGEAIALETVQAPDEAPWQPLAPAAPALQARYLTRDVGDDWRVTSYSGLQQHGSSAAPEWVPRLDVDAAGEAQEASQSALTPHQFPRGASPGTFLHSLLETLDFTQPVDQAWVAEQLAQAGYDAQWQPVVSGWLASILAAPLNDSAVSLHQLSARDRQSELEFYLPVAGPLQATQLDALIRRYDPLSADCPPLDFRQLRGMLKGFIDLVFRWQGRYYLLDYKSNWLGDSSDAYTQEAMAQAMREHRYDLQYQLYTLALHRYLRQRIAGYDYRQHFGGVIYLFLRGVEEGGSRQGIFSTCPEPALIDAMDALFAGIWQEDDVA